ncbi:hypothetical protein [Actinomadura fibrosa]|uniref:Uncharacterized protein n=1 Tax=Actinomadura fibrosa TaxID=111802 RepID=A0ABW2XPX4_9ACTN|nr:hypothetical protein [Actinomadura fibrosa]
MSELIEMTRVPSTHQVRTGEGRVPRTGGAACLGTDLTIVDDLRGLARLRRIARGELILAVPSRGAAAARRAAA